MTFDLLKKKKMMSVTMEKEMEKVERLTVHL